MSDPRFSPPSHFKPMGQLKKGKRITKAQQAQLDKENRALRIPSPTATPERYSSQARPGFSPIDIGDYISVLAIRPLFPTTEVARMKAYAHNDTWQEALAEYMLLSGHKIPEDPYSGKKPSSRSLSAREYVSNNVDPDRLVTKIYNMMVKDSYTKKPWAHHVVFASNMPTPNDMDIQLLEDIQEKISDDFPHTNFYFIHQRTDLSYEELSLRKMQKHIKIWQLMGTFLSLLDWPLTDNHLDEYAERVNRAMLTDLRGLPCGTHLEERDEDNAQEARKREEARVAAATARSQQATGRVRLRPGR